MKVKIIKAHVIYDYDGYQDNTLFYPVAGDWEEVNQKEYLEIKDAIKYANMNSSDVKYLLIEYSENTKDEMFKSASDFKDKIKKREEAEQKQKEEAKQKREEKAMERKKKQLEKLKRELGG